MIEFMFWVSVEIHRNSKFKSSSKSMIHARPLCSTIICNNKTADQSLLLSYNFVYSWVVVYYLASNDFKYSEHVRKVQL